MPVPFEAFFPYGIILTMFCVTGVGLGGVRYLQNGGKPHRYAVGQWDSQMMERDRRLTGYLRGQSDSSKAPEGFELNNPWKVSFLSGPR